MTRLATILGATALSAPLVIALPQAGQAQEQCGEVSITEMNWASAQVVTATAAFLMEQGYGCEVAVVPSDTVPAVTSVSENGEPDIVTELWLNSTGAAYTRLEEQGRVERVNQVLEPGGVEGWWIPTYLAEEHPELTTIEGIMENPDLVGGTFNNCPDGWGCRIVNDNLIRAMALEDSGLEVFNHGSGETLSTSMASAYENEEPWFGYYWGPTVPLGRYDMTRVDLGDIDTDVHARNQNPDAENPGISDFPAAPILTSVTADLAEREPQVVEFLSNMEWQTDTMSALLAWQAENNASAEEAAVYFLRNYQSTWSEWLNDEARANLSALIDQG